MICQSETESTSQIIFITLFSQSCTAARLCLLLPALVNCTEMLSQNHNCFLMSRVIYTEHCWGMFLWVPPIIVCSLKLLFLSFFCNFIHMYGICLSGPCRYVLIETLLKNDWSRWFAISGLPPIWCSQWGGAMAACQWLTHDDGGWRHCVLCECYGVTTQLYTIMCGFGCCWTNNVRTSVGYIRFFTKFKMCTTLVTTRPTLVFFFLLSGQRFWVAVLTLQCMCTLKGGFASRDLPVIWNGLTFGRCGWWWLLTLCVFCIKKKTHIRSVKEDACLPLWMCIEEIEEDLHNQQRICSKTKRKHWFHVD